MNVTTQQISIAIARWFETDVLPKGSLFQQGISTFIFLQAKPRLDNLINGLNMLSDNGNFDVDELCGNLNKSLDKMGGSFTLPFIDYKFDKEDLDKIIMYLRNAK